MKYLIVGLGNPGVKYENTRHNIGFKVVEEFVRQCDGSFSEDKHAHVARVKFKGRVIVVIKPTTYMNLSGKAVNYWLQSEKIPLDNMMVVTDDIALPFGKLRMKGKGSDGGHNGLKDIQGTLNTPKYARLRFGVGNDFHPGQQADYVLGEWKSDEQSQLVERIKIATEFIKGFTTMGLQMTMSAWNNK